jgi:DNA relaxase NicK
MNPNLQKTTIDWLGFRTQADPREALEALRPMFGTLGTDLALKPLERGKLGFQQAAQINIADMQIGRMDFGGESQRGWLRLDLQGTGCEWVKDWQAIESVESLSKAEIRRLDIALTTWQGEITHDSVVQAHQDGRFETGGRPPAMQMITSSDPRAGRTCYVGKRAKSDKFFRAYEKGFEMLGKLASTHPILKNCSHFDNKRVEDIYRCELELKASNADIPWDVIERRDQYFAGAYPFCADVLPGVEADILMRRPERAVQASLAAALQNCLIQYGPTLYTAMHAYGGDISAVWEKVCSDHHSQPLLEAGVLLVEHY